MLMVCVDFLLIIIDVKLLGKFLALDCRIRLFADPISARSFEVLAVLAARIDKHIFINTFFTQDQMVRESKNKR